MMRAALAEALCDWNYTLAFVLMTFSARGHLILKFTFHLSIGWVNYSICVMMHFLLFQVEAFMAKDTVSVNLKKDISVTLYG